MRQAAGAALLLLAGVAQAQTAAQTGAPPTGSDAWLPRGTAELIALDKVRAVPTTLTVPVGGSVRYGTLTIAVRGCAVRPADQARDAAAFLDVTDQGGGAGFRGWMIAGVPALGVLEHPLYDLRVAACR